MIASRGKKRVDHDLRKVDAREVVDSLLGNSGKLRAPTAKVGKTFLVGWGEEAWEELLG